MRPFSSSVAGILLVDKGDALCLEAAQHVALGGHAGLEPGNVGLLAGDGGVDSREAAHGGAGTLHAVLDCLGLCHDGAEGHIDVVIACRCPAAGGSGVGGV